MRAFHFMNQKHLCQHQPSHQEVMEVLLIPLPLQSLISRSVHYHPCQKCYQMTTLLTKALRMKSLSCSHHHWQHPYHLMQSKRWGEDGGDDLKMIKRMMELELWWKALYHTMSGPILSLVPISSWNHHRWVISLSLSLSLHYYEQI